MTFSRGNVYNPTKSGLNINYKFLEFHKLLDNKRLFEKSQQFGNGVRYLPPPKRVPFAAPNVENSTDKGIRTAAAPRTRSPHVYKQTNIQYRLVNERLSTLF